MDNEYTVPLIPKIDPSGKFLVYAKNQKLVFFQIQKKKTIEAEFEDGILFFNFSPNGQFMLVKTSEYIYRYCLREDIQLSGKVEFSLNAKISISNFGDGVIVTIPDVSNKKSKIFIWENNSADLALEENTLGYIEVDNIAYNSASSMVFYKGTYTPYCPESEKTGNVTYGQVIIAKGKVKELRPYDNPDKVFPDAGFHYPFMEKYIIFHSLNFNMLALSNENLHTEKQIPLESLNIKSNILNIALSPLNNYMAILWSEWDGQKDYCYINIISTQDFLVETIIPVKSEMMNFESFSISNNGDLFFAYPTKDLSKIMLYKQNEDSFELIREIKVGSH